MADKIRLKVVTPGRLVLDEEVDEVTAPGVKGEFGVLPNHISFLTLLEPGEMSYKQGTTRRFLAISGGYAEVLDNVMTVLAPAAEFGIEIDVNRDTFPGQKFRCGGASPSQISGPIAGGRKRSEKIAG
jgi:F-type H+-transporting ATPase subunit epsilon